jgi:glycosyltransferase involved in cell wall biosynthesis
LINRKNPQALIRILPEIIKEEPQTKLLIVGRGSLKPQLQRLVGHSNLEQHVFFLEGLSQGELSAAYRLSKIFVLPTLADVAPNVILEALLFQRPVVSTRILGIREFFAETALLVEPGDQVGLKEAVLKLLRDKELCLRLSERGHKLLLSSFSLEKRVEEIASIYRSVL